MNTLTTDREFCTAVYLRLEHSSLPYILQKQSTLTAVREATVSKTKEIAGNTKCHHSNAPASLSFSPENESCTPTGIGGVVGALAPPGR